MQRQHLPSILACGFLFIAGLPAALAGDVPPQGSTPIATPLVPVHKVTMERSNLGTDPALDRWGLCPPLETAPAPGSSPTMEEMEAGEKINLFADRAEISGDGETYTLEGNAVILYGKQQLRADTITYDGQAGSIDAHGNLRYDGPGLVIKGSRAQLFPDTETGTLYDIDYSLSGWHGRGNADVVHLDGRQRQQLKQASYTTCPSGNLDWLLSAEQVDLDHQEGMGSARHAKLEFKEVPILYTPYISFPIDDRRRSGLLTPTVGTSDETGFDVSTPYYWNIAPNYDATLTPRHMSDRGVMLGTEFRYLHKNNSGQFKGEYLPSDSEFDNNNRHLVTFKHNGNPFPRVETGVNASDVSDKDYFQDLGGSLLKTSRTHLKREADVAYHGNRWKLDTRVLNFQTVDKTIAVADRPYKQLPRIRFSAAPRTSLLGLRFQLDSEAVEFDKDNTVTGTRIDLQPRISLPVRNAAWYADPSVSIRHTRYRLDDEAPGDPDNPDRTTPVASLDSGMFFDREFNWRSTDYVQTLEPRLFYLYVPNNNQDDIPVFDTGDYDFNFWQLFLENRFSGPDRMGDANQLAVALTTRVLNPATGIQQLSASLGNLFYFRDREVTLPGEPVDNDKNSDIIGQITMALGARWRARTEWQWDPGETQTSRANATLQYKTSTRQLVNLSYRFRRKVLEQTDVSFLWPVGPHWHLVGRWNYSIDDRQTLDSLAGVGYESCCWGMNLVARNYVNDEKGKRTTGIYLELELKGFTSIGKSIDSVLERGILGYKSDY
ncbi:MAG: LPS-assembly protein LptD [Thiohalobacterales bacterium]